jgi:hypothetical protein
MKKKRKKKMKKRRRGETCGVHPRGSVGPHLIAHSVRSIARLILRSPTYLHLKQYFKVPSNFSLYKQQYAARCPSNPSPNVGSTELSTPFGRVWGTGEANSNIAS